jgi:hypothetical protein
MTKKFAAAMFALLTLTAPVRAATITWYLNAAPEFQGLGQFPEFNGETITGFLDWNTVTNTPTAWNFVGKGPTPFGGITFTCDPTCGAAIATNPHQQGLNLGNVALGIGTISALDGPAHLLLLNSNSSLRLSHRSNVFGMPDDVPIEAEIFGTLSDTPPAVPAVPLPPALPLFGSAVLGLAGFAAYRSRRAARG